MTDAAAPKRGGRRWLVWTAVLLSATAGYSAGTWIARKQEGLYAKLADAEQQFQELRQAHNEVKGKADKLERDHAALQESHRILKEERDRIATEAQATVDSTKSQLAALQEERQRLILLTERLGQENKSLTTQVGVLDQEVSLAQKTNEKLTLQRDTIQKQLARAERRSAENQLRGELVQRQKEIQELKRSLLQAKKAEAQLAKVQSRMKQVQAEHVKLVAERKEFKKQAEGVPANVTRMAKQHERLLRETANMHYNLGVLLSKQKDYPKASKEFQKVIELRPDDADAHYNLGVIFAEHIPNRPKAMDYFRKYLSLKPNAQDASWVKQYIATWQAWEGKERLD